MRTILVTAALMATLTVVPAAEAQRPTGNLSVEEAKTSVRRALPGQAPRVLLKDERAEFFSTTSIDITGSRRLTRSEVNVRYKLVMNPDKAHRKAGWFPIHCKGLVWIGKLKSGRLVGDTKDYTCKTVT